MFPYKYNGNRIYQRKRQKTDVVLVGPSMWQAAWRSSSDSAGPFGDDDSDDMFSKNPAASGEPRLWNSVIGSMPRRLPK
jgi:hypothetical protein